MLPTPIDSRSNGRSHSPTPSGRSTRSFLTEDPYPSSSHLSHPHPQSLDASQTSSDVLLKKLEGFLAAKAEEIQLAGRLGESLLGQQAELEARIKELSEVQRVSSASPSLGGTRRARGSSPVPGGAEDNSDGEKEVGLETRQKLTELEEELRRWDETNSGLYQTVGIAAATGVPTYEVLLNGEEATTTRDPSLSNGSLNPRPALPKKSSMTNLQASPSTSSIAGEEGTTSASSRRQRNNQHRANDIEFATEIGTGLLVEVRRLTKLLSDTTEQLKESEEAKHQIEKNLNSALSARRTAEESVEKYKEENWNFELASQELRQNHSDAQDSLRRANLERAQATTSLSSTRELLDTQRSEAEKLAAQLESQKARHETEMATMRQTNAGLSREKSNMQSSIDALKTELVTAQRGIKRSDSNMEVENLGEGMDEPEAGSDEEEDPFKTGFARRKTGDLPMPFSEGNSFGEIDQDSADGSPARGASDVDSLRAALAQQQKINTRLKIALDREKRAKMELRKPMGDGGDTWDDDESGSSAAGTPVRLSSARGMRGSSRGGRGASRRRGGGLGVPSRLAHGFAGDDSIEEVDDDEEGAHADSFESPSGGIFDHQFPQEDDVSESGTDAGFDSPYRNQRASTDIDHDFAQHSRSLDFSDEDNGSPAPHRSRRPLSIASIQDTRSTSSMFLGESLPIVSPPPAKVWVDQETMTDFPEPIPTPIFVPPAPPQVSHAAVQMTPEPVPITATSDFAGQTEPAVVIVTKESGTSTDISPTLVEFATSTDVPHVTEMQVQTDTVPTPIAKAIVVPEVHNPDRTVKSLEGLIAGLRPHASEDTDSDVGKAVGTDNEFEDARESVGILTPSSSTGDVKSRPAPFTKVLPDVVEAGVQTDEWSPPSPPVPVSTSMQKRDSINTFGRAASPEAELIEVSAAAATAFLGAAAAHQLHDRFTEDRPESAMSSFSQSTDTPSLPPKSAVDKGKGVALMGPPAVPRLALRPKVAPVRSGSTSLPPTRPTSPPPADLLYRAQSPTHDLEYERRASTLNAGSMYPPRNSSRAQSLRRQASSNMTEAARRQMSSGVSISEISVHSDASRRISGASSRTSDGGYDNAGRASGDSTDPVVIHAITQTMIGESLFKYTRKSIGKGISEKRHKRYFWVHPYTKTLYWSASTPGEGSSNTAQTSSKSVLILAVRQVVDPNPFPAGLHPASIVVTTPNREVKFTAPTRERHDMWFNAINYLLARPENVGEVTTPSTPTLNAKASRTNLLRQRLTGNTVYQTPSSTASSRSNQVYSQTNASESRVSTKNRAKFSTSTFRAPTPTNEFGARGLSSPRSMRTLNGKDDDLDIIDRDEVPTGYGYDPDEYEGLENVRACCDGKHDVGSLTRHHHHSSRDTNPRSHSRASFGGSFSRRVAAPTNIRKSSVASFATSPLTPLTTTNK